MRRIEDDNAAELSGQDSFLDIVANIVGILILLVMVVGVRASRATKEALNAPKPAEQDQGQALDETAVHDAVLEAKAAHLDVTEVVKRMVGVHREALLRDEERIQMATYVAAVERELEDRRAQLDVQQQRDFDARRKLNEAQQTLDEMTREQIALLSQAPEVEEIECLPTPLAKVVDGDRIHLRLYRGHVAYVPLDKLMEEFTEHASSHLWELQDRNSTVATVGPIDGFRLRVHVQKSRFTAPVQSGASRQGWLTQATLFELLPTSTLLGEPVEQAILPTSDLWRHLQNHPPHDWTVTVWTYPGTFNEFRTLKKALFEKGYAIAGRPLPEGTLIAGSPSGTRSAVQ